MKNYIYVLIVFAAVLLAAIPIIGVGWCLFSIALLVFIALVAEWVKQEKEEEERGWLEEDDWNTKR